MAWGATEIAELKERVARIAPDNVPREDATPQLFTQFEDRRGAQTVQAAPVSAPQTPAEAPSQNSDTLELEEAPLSDAVLNTVIQTPKAQSPANAAEPSQSKPISVPSGDMVRMDTKAGGNDEVGKVERDEKALDGKLLELSRKADPGDLHDSHVGSGYRSRLVNAQENAKVKAQKQRDQQTMQLALAGLQNQLDAIDAEIDAFEKRNQEIDRQLAANNARIEEIDERLDEIDRQREALKRYADRLESGGAVELDENGELKDRTAEKALQDYEKRTGQKVDRAENDAVLRAIRQQQQTLNVEANGLGSQKDDLNAQNDALQAERDYNTAKIEDLSQRRDQILASDMTDEQKAKEVGKLTEEAKGYWQNAKELRAQKRGIESQEGVDDKSEIEEQSEKRGQVITVDEEIEKFMRDFAEIEKITDPAERLKLEKEIVDGLSEDAAENLSWEPSTEQLFTEGYFDALDKQQIASASDLPPPANGMPAP